MFNKCSEVGCSTNYSGYGTSTVFPLPKAENQKKQWLKFLQRPDATSLKNIFICYKHLPPDVVVKTPKRLKLLHEMKPVPTIIPESQKTVNLPSIAVLDTLKTPQKPSKVRVFHEYEYIKFKATDEITALEHITENKVKQLWEDFKIKSLPDGAIIYCLKMDSEFTQITYCIKVDQSLCLKLFYKWVPIHLPFWFSVGKNSRLASWSMVPNFVSHMKERSEETKSVLCELNSACLDQWLDDILILWPRASHQKCA